jgi:hypothetical protein
MNAPDARRRDPESQADLLDNLPVVGRATTQLERSFGPSCLLSLVIVLLVTMLVKRYVGLSWTSLGCLTAVVWFLVLMVLIRWRPDAIVDED